MIFLQKLFQELQSEAEDPEDLLPPYLPSVYGCRSVEEFQVWFLMFFKLEIEFHENEFSGNYRSLLLLFENHNMKTDFILLTLLSNPNASWTEGIF